jgi:hypothetical protein
MSRLHYCVFALALLTGCAHARSSTPVAAGFLLPGPHAAQAFGVAPAARLPEQPATAVVPRVVRASRSAAVQRDKKPECTRYFHADRIAIVVLSAFCGRHFGKEADTRILIGFRLDGSMIGEISWMPTPGVAELEPLTRYW